MIFIQNIDPDTSTFTYLLADPESKDAVLIDPVLAQLDRDISLLERLGLTLRYTMETHVHADHVSGGGRLRQRLGSQTVIHASGGVDCADIKVQDGDRLTVGAIQIDVRYTPGHTSGCTSYVVGDRVFTGDALLIGGCGRTDFQQGSPTTLYQSIHTQLFSLPDGTTVFPGHDYNGNAATTIGWEKAHNKRLGGGRSEADFVEIMEKLNLSEPRQIHIAVPANLRCGLPERSAETLKELATDRAGVADVTPAVAQSWLDLLRVVDVREPDELVGPLHRLASAENVPLATVGDALTGWDRDQPVLMVCRSGGRSGRAAAALVQAGFSKVFNLEGGMMAWNDASLPVQTASPKMLT